MQIVLYWIYATIIFFISVIPGFAVAKKFKLSEVERFAISFGISFLILALIALLLALNLGIFAKMLFAFILVLSVFRLKKVEVANVRFIVLILLIAIVLRLFIQTLWEYPVLGGDWYFHTLVKPLQFENGDWSPSRDRTILFSVIIYTYHSILGTSLYSFWVSQIVGVIANSIFIIPAYLIAEKNFGERIAKISCTFMVITPFLFENSIYPWPKNLVTYFILLMVYFLFFRRPCSNLNYVFAGFFGGMGYLCHNYAGIYILVGMLVAIFRKEMIKVGIFLLALNLVISPYLVWNYASYGTIFSSRFIYYPFAVEGWDSAIDGSLDELSDSFYSTPAREIVEIRLRNAFQTITPIILKYSPLFYYYHSYPGALSFLMYILVIISFFKYIFGKSKMDSVLVSFTIIPFILTVILCGWWEWGLVRQTLHPTVPLLIMCGFSKLRNEYILYLTFIGALVEDVIFGKLISDFYYGVERELLVGGVRRYIFDFQSSDLVSAHFLINTPQTFFANIFITFLAIFLLCLCLKNT